MFIVPFDPHLPVKRYKARLGQSDVDVPSTDLGTKLRCEILDSCCPITRSRAGVCQGNNRRRCNSIAEVSGKNDQ